MNLKAFHPKGSFIEIAPEQQPSTDGDSAATGGSAPTRNSLPNLGQGPTDSSAFEQFARLSFDGLFQANLTDTGLDVTIHPLRDVSADFGFPDGTLLTLTQEKWFSLMVPEDRERVLRAIEVMVETSGNYFMEYRTLDSKGNVMWWESAGGPVEFKDGKAIRWVGGDRNITARKKREEQLTRALMEAETIRSRLEVEVDYLRGRASEDSALVNLVGHSPPFQRVLRQAELVASTESTILITGETGTGKGVIARAIHRLSSRHSLPLITVNCAALPASLIESELFGHQKGAFTGATSNQPGRFEIADGGTLFLDEIGELPLELQAKLLRVLETGEFERVGSTQTRKVNVRLVAATNRDLATLANEDRFRRDLYYRLQVFPIEIPPLRERKEDLDLLVTYILERKCSELGRPLKQVSPETLEQLHRYDWPGNVRELENVIERAIILSTESDLVLDITSSHPSPPRPAGPTSSTPPPASSPKTLVDMERDHIIEVCETANWRIKGPGGAAERLGLPPSTLHFRMKKHGITRPS